MEWSHLGLARRPFRPAVDTTSYFPAAAHEAALAALAAAFDRRDAAVLIDGPPGTGKSLVARRWLEHLPPDVPRVLLPNTHADRPAELLQAVLFDLDRPYQGLTEQELRLAVTAELLAAAATGHPTVLLLDEAQHLGPAAGEELRLLGNVETAGGGSLLVVLVAQPGFRDALAGPFAQRVAVRCRVGPLSAEESAAYLRHQVRAAGGDPDAVLDGAAVALLAGACGGVPRVLNQAAGLAAELAESVGAGTIDVEAALEALSRLGLAAEPDEAAEPAVIPHPARPAEPAQAARSRSRAGLNAAGGGDANSGAAPKQKPARKRSA